MKKTAFVTLVIVLTVAVQFCSTTRYVDPVFLEKAANHQVIAVLPFEMVFTGKQPKKLSLREIRKIEEVESIAFQNSLYHLLQRQQSRHRQPLIINIQPIKSTNRILDAEGIGIRDSWHMGPAELARILGVDAVVRTRVEKRRYMSGLASFGVEIGNIILNEILRDTPFGIFIDNPTSRVRAECVLVNGRDGYVLWGEDVTDRADWTQPANAIIDGINRHIARAFPYR